MSLKTELATLLKASLQDVRCAAPRFFIEECFKRTVFGGGIPEHRLTETVTELPVTDMTELMSHITEDNIKVRVYNGNKSNNFKDKCKPISLTLENVVVNLNKNCEEDSFCSQYNPSTTLKFCFIMGYVGDNDQNLPLKLIDCFLVSA